MFVQRFLIMSTLTVAACACVGAGDALAQYGPNFYGYGGGYPGFYGYYPGYFGYYSNPYWYDQYYGYHPGYIYKGYRPGYYSNGYHPGEDVYSPWSNSGSSRSTMTSQQGQLSTTPLGQLSTTPLGQLSSQLGAPTESDQVARIDVHVPADAEVWFNDNKTAQTGTIRKFLSPPLVSGTPYTYEIHARWKDKGRETKQSQSITFHAGERAKLVFPKAASKDANGSDRQRSDNPVLRSKNAS
jgi:uncharacterized protein (TIGR03000 family)